MRKLLLFISLTLLITDVFSQSTDDIYFDGVEEQKVIVILAKQNTISDSWVDRYDDFSYQTTIRRFHQPIRGFSYYSPYYVNIYPPQYLPYYYPNMWSWNYNPNNWGWYNWHYNSYAYNWNYYNNYTWRNNYYWSNWNFNNNFLGFRTNTNTNSNYITTRSSRSSDTGRNNSRNIGVRGYDNIQKPVDNSVRSFNNYERTNGRTNTLNRTNTSNNINNSYTPSIENRGSYSQPSPTINTRSRYIPSSNSRVR
jgi:hypothetical protein